MELEGVAGRRKVGTENTNAYHSHKFKNASFGNWLWNGIFHSELQKTNAQISAIDISPDLLEIAKKRINHKNVIFMLENGYEQSFPSECFDTIVGSSVLHHLDVDRALKEFYRVLKKTGSIYFTEPNMLNPQIALQKNIPWLKKRLGDSPDEIAFFRWNFKKQARKIWIQ